MTILLLTTERFPQGGASANRILSIGKGLQSEGQKVSVICLRPADRILESIENKHQGIYEGISYKYIHGYTIWPEQKLKKFFVLFKLYFLFALEMKRYGNRKDEIRFLICADDFLLNIEIWIFRFLFKAKSYLVLDEYPPFMREGKFFFKLFTRMTKSLRYRLCDGIILISDILINYYKKVTKGRIELYKLPITLEIERFKNIKPVLNDDFHYITYCGLEPKIDGLDILIKAYATVTSQLPQCKLLIIGDTRNGIFDAYKALVNELGINSKVIFTGMIARENVPGYLVSSSILVIPRPLSANAHGGFPTKLGEYLATRKPVIVTKTGEIANYIKNENTGYLINPGDCEALAMTIVKVIRNYDFAIKVGERGFTLAQRIFDIHSQSKGILELLK